MDWLLWGFLGVVLVFSFVVVRGAPYVPSHRKYAVKSLTELYRLTEKDTLVDLGSGDGLILRIASTKGARAVGYELNPILVVVTKLLSLGDKKVNVKTADFWLVDIPKNTTIVYAFSVSRDAKKLKRKMQEWANQKGGELYLMTYGSKLPMMEPVKELDGHTLYRFITEALQGHQA